jgi:hypothetical protein
MSFNEPKIFTRVSGPTITPIPDSIKTQIINIKNSVDLKNNVTEYELFVKNFESDFINILDGALAAAKIDIKPTLTIDEIRNIEKSLPKDGPFQKNLAKLNDIFSEMLSAVRDLLGEISAYIDSLLYIKSLDEAQLRSLPNKKLLSYVELLSDNNAKQQKIVRMIDKINRAIYTYNLTKKLKFNGMTVDLHSFIPAVQLDPFKAAREQLKEQTIAMALKQLDMFSNTTKMEPTDDVMMVDEQAPVNEQILIDPNTIKQENQQQIIIGPQVAEELAREFRNELYTKAQNLTGNQILHIQAMPLENFTQMQANDLTEYYGLLVFNPALYNQVVKEVYDEIAKIKVEQLQVEVHPHDIKQEMNPQQVLPDQEIKQEMDPQQVLPDQEIKQENLQYQEMKQEEKPQIIQSGEEFNAAIDTPSGSTVKVEVEEVEIMEE